MDLYYFRTLLNSTECHFIRTKRPFSIFSCATRGLICSKSLVATVVVVHVVVVFQFFLVSVFGASPRCHFEFGALVQARSFSREQATWRKSTNQSLA